MRAVWGSTRKLRKGFYWAALLSAFCAAFRAFHFPLLCALLLCLWVPLALGLQFLLRQRNTLILCSGVGFLVGFVCLVPAILMTRSPSPPFEGTLVLAFAWLVASTMIGAGACQAVVYVDWLIGILDRWFFGMRDLRRRALDAPEGEAGNKTE